MKAVHVLIIVACAIISLTACKKTADTQQPQTKLQMIQAKWQLKSEVGNSHYSGQDHPYSMQARLTITSTLGQMEKFILRLVAVKTQLPIVY